MNDSGSRPRQFPPVQAYEKVTPPPWAYRTQEKKLKQNARNKQRLDAGGLYQLPPPIQQPLNSPPPISL